MVTPSITIAGDGELTIRIGTSWEGSTFRAAGLTVSRFNAEQSSAEARLVTGYLADPTARPLHLLRSARCA